jgi:anti-anti-sigma factor
MAPAEQQPADKLLVAIDQDIAFVRVQGRGSFKVSTALKDFASAAIESGATQMVLDMNQCVGMDSTFMGVLAGLAFRLKDKPNSRIIMVNLSLRTRGLLATLGLDQVIEPYMAGVIPEHLKGRLPEGTEHALTSLDTTTDSTHQTTQTMLEAHENLVQLSPENLPKFKDVLTFLREDLKKAGQGPRDAK